MIANATPPIATTVRRPPWTTLRKASGGFVIASRPRAVMRLTATLVGTLWASAACAAPEGRIVTSTSIFTNRDASTGDRAGS